MNKKSERRGGGGEGGGGRRRRGAIEGEIHRQKNRVLSCIGVIWWRTIGNQPMNRLN